jgi:hypothetical protein
MKQNYDEDLLSNAGQSVRREALIRGASKTPAPAPP